MVLNIFSVQDLGKIKWDIPTMTLANTRIFYNGANTDLPISEMQSLACQFHKCYFKFVRGNTDLSISEGFFKKILDFCSVLATPKAPSKWGKLVHFWLT